MVRSLANQFGGMENIDAIAPMMEQMLDGSPPNGSRYSLRETLADNHMGYEEFFSSMMDPEYWVAFEEVWSGPSYLGILSRTEIGEAVRQANVKLGHGDFGGGTVGAEAAPLEAFAFTLANNQRSLELMRVDDLSAWAHIDTKEEFMLACDWLLRESSLNQINMRDEMLYLHRTLDNWADQVPGVTAPPREKIQEMLREAFDKDSVREQLYTMYVLGTDIRTGAAIYEHPPGEHTVYGPLQDDSKLPSEERGSFLNGLMDLINNFLRSIGYGSEQGVEAESDVAAETPAFFAEADGVAAELAGSEAGLAFGGDALETQAGTVPVVGGEATVRLPG